MKAPPRLLEQSELGDVLRADLNAAREQNQDPSYDLNAGLVALKKAMDGASGGPGSSSAPSGEPGKRKSPSTPSIAPTSTPKFLILAGALGAAGLLLWLGWNPWSPSDRSNMDPGHQVPREAVDARGQTTPALPPEENGAHPAPIPTRPEETRPAGEHAKDPVVTAQREPSLVQSKETKPPAGTSEVAHLAEVRRALGSDPNRAVQLATEGHQRYQSGFLFEEREGLAILALQKAGRVPEAKSRARAYQTRFPKSALLPKMAELLK